MLRPHMKDRGWEIMLGFGLFILGSFLLYDAFDGRGKKMAWPLSTVFPW